VAPTVLVGTRGKAGAFTETVVREMASRVDQRIILPLSNPTANAEATPTDVLAWSEGRAVVATGSPFGPVEHDGRTSVIGQANNVFVFPGLGLGIIAAQATEVTDSMFLVAARELSKMVSDQRLELGALYPPLSELRSVSRTIAVAVGKEARDRGVAPAVDDQAIQAAVDAATWTPEYRSLVLPIPR
jgi:malic enzyme